MHVIETLINSLAVLTHDRALHPSDGLLDRVQPESERGLVCGDLSYLLGRLPGVCAEEVAMIGKELGTR